MRKKLATKVLLTLACLCLLAGTLYASPPPGCWYTGEQRYDFHTHCNHCYLVYGNAPEPDAMMCDVYYQYECPGGTFGWDYMRTELAYCYYWTMCDHQ